MSEIKYPVRVVQDPESIEFHIRDASNRVIATGLIGCDACAIASALNEVHERAETEPRQLAYVSYGGWSVADLDKRLG